MTCVPPSHRERGKAAESREIGGRKIKGVPGVLIFLPQMFLHWIAGWTESAETSALFLSSLHRWVYENLRGKQRFWLIGTQASRQIGGGTAIWRGLGDAFVTQR